MQVIRWQETATPEEQHLRQQMQQQGLTPYAWSNGPDEYYAVHSHAYQKILYCVCGSISFILPDKRDETGAMITICLNAGDGLVLPKGTRHSAQVGLDGVTCLEAAQS